MSEPVKCEYQVFRGSFFDPPEYCPNDAEPGETYCLDHLPEIEDFNDFEWDEDDQWYDSSFYDEFEGMDE